MALEKNEYLLQTVAARLRVLREKTGATQEEVYHETGIHVGRIEAGKANITVSTLYALCTFYGISLAKFFEDFPVLNRSGADKA